MLTDNRISYSDVSGGFSLSYEVKHVCITKIAYPSEEEAEEGEIDFDIKEGIPIKLNIENYADIHVSCIHELMHIFQLPVMYDSIEWKILGGLKNGAFKTGYGTNTQYVSVDSGDCTIFFPSIKQAMENEKYDVKILVTVNPLKLKDHTKPVYNFILNVEIMTIKKLLKNNYKARISLTKIEGDNKTDLDKIPENLTRLYQTMKPEHDIENLAISKMIMEENDDNNLISFKTKDGCAVCDLEILFQLPQQSPVLMAPLQNHLITSETIKFTTVIGSDYGSGIVLTGNKYKNHFLDDIVIKPILIWTYNLGETPCGNISDCLVYITPDESALTKSPLVMYLSINYGLNSENMKRTNFSDKKKFWFLRQALMGG